MTVRRVDDHDRKLVEADGEYRSVAGARLYIKSSSSCCWAAANSDACTVDVRVQFLEGPNHRQELFFFRCYIVVRLESVGLDLKWFRKLVLQDHTLELEPGNIGHIVLSIGRARFVLQLAPGKFTMALTLVGSISVLLAEMISQFYIKYMFLPGRGMNENIIEIHERTTPWMIKC